MGEVMAEHRDRDGHLSKFAMDAAMKLQKHAYIDRVTTPAVADVIQSAIDDALQAHGCDTSRAAVAD